MFTRRYVIKSGYNIFGVFVISIWNETEEQKLSSLLITLKLSEIGTMCLGVTSGILT